MHCPFIPISLSFSQDYELSDHNNLCIVCAEHLPNTSDFVFFFFFNLFIYFWVCWVFVSVRGLSPVPASGGHSSSRCVGLSLSQPLPLRSTGSRRAGSIVVAHGPSCSAACGIFPDQGSNPCPLHWQADSQPMRHQGSPRLCFFKVNRCLLWHSHKASTSLCKDGETWFETSSILEGSVFS